MNGLGRLIRTEFDRFESATKAGVAVLLLLCLLWPCFRIAAADEGSKALSGRKIMAEAGRRHEMYPHVYEEQTIVMKDGKGNRDVRRARRFSRIEKDGTFRFLLVFDSPEDVLGVALLTTRQPDDSVQSGIYFPASGRMIALGSETWGGGQFLGTDFSVCDLAPENMEDFRYVRKADKEIDDVAYYTVDAYPVSQEIEKKTGYGLRRHLIRKDILFVVRTDYYDRRERYFKTQTRHDLKQVAGEMWRADMVLMENHKENHMTLIKIDRRVFSHDYVPAEMFTVEWIRDRHNLIRKDKRLFRDDFLPPSLDIVGEAGRRVPIVFDDVPPGPRTGPPGDYSIEIPRSDSSSSGIDDKNRSNNSDR